MLRPLERGIYRLCGVDDEQEQHWLSYAVSVLAFSFAGFATLYGLQRLQGMLPFNPAGQTAVSPDLAFNTSVSFVTNTNWQSYTPETTMSYLTQMAGLTVHNFVSAATGIALAVALVRGFARRSGKTIGNFWADLTRCVLYILLPAAIVIALVFVWQGMPQNLNPYTDATTLEGVKQVIAQGPVASQEVIKIMGTNGGGFFNANSAHPYENPTGLTNLIEMLLIFSLGAGLTNLFGRMVGSERQGWAIWAVMFILFAVGICVAYPVEVAGQPRLRRFPCHPDRRRASSPAATWKARKSASASPIRSLFATITTDTSCGAVNTMHDSLLPLAGAVPMVNIMLGCIAFGGVGSGLYGMLLFVIVAMFVAGLMVGRTPEYLGKKLESKEVKMAMLAILMLPLSILGWTALAVVLPVGTAAMNNAGPHGFSEALYAYSSATGNNGSAFAGISANVPFWNDTLGMAMFMGRFLVIIPMLAIAGSLVGKKIVPASAGTFPTDRPLFVGLVVGVILITGGLIYFPAVSLGPIVENFAMHAGTLY